MSLCDHIRASLRGLLNQFPLMFGYWQRFARFERSTTAALELQSNQSSEDEIQSKLRSQSRNVLEEGLRAIPHSHELWSLLAAEMLESFKLGEQNIEQVRRSVITFAFFMACHHATSNI